MKQKKPRKKKPVTFDLRVKIPREATIIDVKEQPITELENVLRMLKEKL